MPIFGAAWQGRLVDSAVTVPISGGTNTTLTTDHIVARTITLTGALTANVAVIFPVGANDAGLMWLVLNSTTGAFTVTVQAATGTGVTIAQGKSTLVRWDGTNVTAVISDPNAGGAAKSGANTDITALTGITGGITAAGGLNLAGALSGNGQALQYGRLSLSVAGSANVSLTAAQAANPILEFTGALTGSIQVIVPALTAGAEWEVSNLTSGAFTLTFIGQTGTGVGITQGQRQRCYCDGTNLNGSIQDAVTLAIGNGTVLTKYVAYASALTPASVAANTQAEQLFTLTGLATNDKVVINQPGTNPQGLFLVNARVSATNTLALTYQNTTGGALTPTAQTYQVLAFRN